MCDLVATSHIIVYLMLTNAGIFQYLLVQMNRNEEQFCFLSHLILFDGILPVVFYA